MSDLPPSFGAPSTPPGPAHQPQAPVTQTGWYQGPYPPPGSQPPRESFARAAGMAIVKALIAVTVFGIGVFTLSLLAVVLLAALASSLGTVDDANNLDTTFVAGNEKAETVLLAVPVSGPILGEGDGAGGLFGAGDVTYGYDVKDRLADAAERDDIAGVVLEMHTPGGTIYGSRAIYDGVAAYRQATGKPVLAYVGSLSASGGMYAMAGADEIVADHGTLVGSIGVIFGPFERYEGIVGIDGGLLLGGIQTTGGITFEYLTAGRSKDMGSPYRAMTDEERQVLQDGLDNAYAEFVAIVSDGRSIDPDTVRDKLGALIYDERTAIDLGLVDGIADREQAYARAAEMAGVADGDWKVERLVEQRGGLLGLGLSAGDAEPAATTPTGEGSVRCVGVGQVLAYYGDPRVLCR